MTEPASIVLQVRIYVERVEAAPAVYAVLKQAEKPTPYVPRQGSDGERVMGLLREAGSIGLSEAQLVSRLRQQGRLSNVKHAGRSVHWILYNLRRRTKAIERDESGRWRVTEGTFDGEHR